MEKGRVRDQEKNFLTRLLRGYVTWTFTVEESTDDMRGISHTSTSKKVASRGFLERERKEEGGMKKVGAVFRKRISRKSRPEERGNRKRARKMAGGRVAEQRSPRTKKTKKRVSLPEDHGGKVKGMRIRD